MSSKNAIAIIGSGCRFPGNANSPSRLWDILHNPPDLSSKIPEDRFNTQGFFHKDPQYHGHTNVDRAYLLSGSEEGVYRQFDAQFFGISTAEARVMDPQIRLLLETVFEALESAGQTMEDLQGSNTAVYSGLMTGDYEHLMTRDEDSMSTYHVTGTSRALMSNRISYFFDWRGPSMTIDTACSSSLYAVHQAVQQLRSGDSRVAVATGANLILDPILFITESKMQMLSPTGRSRMWDADADGYARGEGVAAIVMKTLEAAEADGDPIECIIRETAVGQDGRTKGITVPNPEAQSTIIVDCYRRAGLDISRVEDRPQYFEAHGTGTAAGDPEEAKAIHSAFFSGKSTGEFSPLLVGSAKTVIGHTEGTAGLAGVLKASLALQKSIIPPNLLFRRLNPRVAPFYGNLQIPTNAVPWPTLPDKCSRRASINSFGFGGANAHAILESYSPVSTPPRVGHEDTFYPFLFSAISEKSLIDYLEVFREYLIRDGSAVNIQDLSYTLNYRRTRFSLVVTFSASTIKGLASRIGEKIDSMRSKAIEHLGTPIAPLLGRKPRVLVIFTGQGAQWPRMGAQLIEGSAYARGILKRLEARLARLPAKERPTWNLTEELLKAESSSQVSSAFISQPLCTAIQIVLIELLREAGVEFTAVVGHSSGEIAAAYASGLISADDAICIAYYRGLYSDLAKGSNGQSGAMLAVGTSFENAQELLDEDEFQGRACIAAINSSDSITIAGDSDAIQELGTIFTDEKVFSRPLRVSTAYHSHHMAPCSPAYLDALRRLDIRVQRPSQTKQPTWFSSVQKSGRPKVLIGDLQGPYWDRNMVSPVLFQQAVARACAEVGSFDLAIEIGPHPALKGPTLQTIQETLGAKVPYTGLFQRKRKDLEAVAQGFGHILTHLGKGSVDLRAYGLAVFEDGDPSFVKNLPTYCWNHEIEYWHESRYTKAIRTRSDRVHELLGHRCPDSTQHEIRWRHMLRPKEIPWIKGHQLQGQIVFPAAGYVSAALEASHLVFQDAPILCIDVLDLEIEQALTFDEEDTMIETLFSMTDIQKHGAYEATAKFTYNAARAMASGSLSLLASGRIRVQYGEPSATMLPARNKHAPNLMKVQEKSFYDALRKLDYQYSGPFVALSGIERRLGTATGYISTVEDSTLMVHPAVLDVAFQSVFLAACAPDDGTLWSMHVPTRVRRVSINPLLCLSEMGPNKKLPFDAIRVPYTKSIIGDVELYPVESENAMVQVEGLECVPFTPATEKNDRALFNSTIWTPMLPDVEEVAFDGAVTDEQRQLAHVLERMAYYYLWQLDQSVPPNHPSRQQDSYVQLFKFASNALSQTTTSDQSVWRPEWEQDTLESISSAYHPYRHTIDVRILNALGSRLADIATGEIPAIEIGTKDQLLTEYYQDGLGMREYTKYLARVIKQITLKTPRLRCLEIGAGTGGATKVILAEAGEFISSYTFTDISSGFFDNAQAAFADFADRMTFKALDICVDPREQGFEEYSYDLIVASAVLHATPSLDQTLHNVRRLLKPGGYLAVVEVDSNQPIRIGTMFGAFPGWWLGVDEGRDLSPCLSLADWDDLLHRTGFSGCDTTMSSPEGFVNPLTLFVSQRVDDKISFLRDPISDGPQIFHPGHAIQDLVILGGANPSTFKLALRASRILRRYCANIKTIRGLQDVQDLRISSHTTILSLVELDQALFKDITEGRWNAFKRILQEARTVLWVTQGRRASNPYANMTSGFFRSVTHERPVLDYQCLDVENIKSLTPEVLAKVLLQFQAAGFWRRNTIGNFHMAIERELVIDEYGRMLVPRLIANQEMTRRHNAIRRPILESTVLRDHDVSVVLDGREVFLRKETRNLAELRSLGKVTYSTMTPVRLTRQSRMFLALGKYHDSADQFISLSLKHSVSAYPTISLPLPSAVPSGSEALFLRLITLHHVSSTIVQDLEDGDRVLVHEPIPALVSILKNTVVDHELNNVEVLFTTSRPDGHPACLKVHSHLPKRALESLKLQSITAFIDLALTEESRHVARQIRTRLPKSCRSDSATAIFGGEPKAPSRARTSQILNHLENTTQAAYRDIESISKESLEYSVIGIDQVSNHDYSEASQCIIDWNTADQVSTRVEPIDSQPLFSTCKTYWLVGLTGSLALSLCKWMVLHGAKYVVLSSRTPKIDRAWKEEMAELGAVIRIMTIDITKKEDLRKAHEEISSTLPPIAGVAQGAMVLRDNLMRDIPLEDVYEVTRPKVEGSIYLNELFQDNTLDFFVFLSSLSSVLGIPGQSCYTAANLFMSSLAEQRRQAGLAASVINIGIIYGAGYVTEQQRDMTSISLTMATIPMSEHDFHQMFAEAVIAGSPGASTLAEISAGPRPVQVDEEIQPKWAPNPFFTHLLVDVPAECSDSAATNRKKTVSLETQLLAARSIEDVHLLIKTAILEKLRTMFQFDFDMVARTGLDAIRLDDLGVDSLMAVEIRAWMAKSLRINYPVLKILSGVSIGELVRVGVDGVPPEMVPGLQSQTRLPSASPPKVNGHTVNGHKENGHRENGQVNGTNLNTIPATLSVGITNGNGPAVKPTSSLDLPDSANLMFMDLSPTQQMFWLSSNMLHGSTGLNHTAMFRLTGPLRLHDLEVAVRKVGQQHESLRTCFLERHGRLMQAIMEKSTLQLEHRLIFSEDESQRAAQEVHEHAYDIGRGQTLRLVLLSLSDSEHFLIFGCTGLALDGVSFQVFLQDLLQHYHHENYVSEIPQYRNFFEVQDHASTPGHFEKEIQYWNAKYPDFPPPLPILRVSSATSRPSLASFSHEKASLSITRKTKLQIQAICKRYRVTPFHFYLACLRVLLARYADIDDVSIGIGDANRSDDSMMRCIGTFFNVLPLRFRTQSGVKFNELLRESCTAAYEAMENSRLPFQTLLNELKPPRSPTHTTLFQSFVNYRVGQRQKQTWGSCELEMQSYEISQTGYDLNLDIIDDPEGECFLALYVRRGLYSTSEAETLIKSYGKLVSSFAATPDIDCDEAYMYDSDDVGLVLDFSQGLSYPSQWPETVVHQIESIAEKYPDSPAVRNHDGCTTTYSQLSELSWTIASALTAAGADIGSVIAVLQEPSPIFIASILAIMRIGSIYLPLDLFAPPSRLVAIVDNCKPKLFLVDITTNHRIHDLLGSQPATINVSLLNTERQLKTPIAATADGLAMILYTSGSTGIPKGISLKHEGIRNQIEHMQDIYGIGAEVVLQQSAPSFDLSYAQVFMALCFGGSVHPLPSGLRGDAFAITELIASQGITCTFATPTEYSSWQKYAQGQGLANSSWRTALCAGESVPYSLLAQFRGLNKPDLRLFNAYGPTEVSVLASAMELKYMDDAPFQGIIPAGSVLPNYSIHILDEQFNHVPPGVQGEVYIGGAGVAAGYVHNPVLSAERFVLDPFASDHFKRHGWTRMHRVGDRGRWREDGSIVIEGRVSGDTQVKIRGIRVDLCEVEDAILRVAQGALADAVVSVRRSVERSEDASQFLVAHVVFDPKHPEQDREGFLQRLPSALELPSYMRPVGLFALDKMPRTTSSKLDRRAIGALKLPDVLGGCEENRLAWDITQTEAQLRDIWFDVVKPRSRTVYSINPQTDFFDVGGNSLLLLEVKGKIQAVMGKTLQVGQMLQSSTLGHMAGLIDRGQGQASNAIDWESETALPQSVVEAGGTAETVTVENGRVVVLTGATGYLGSAILDALIAEDEVKKVHCIGVRDMASREAKINSPKVHFYEGDLKLPRLGLSEDDARHIFREADRIIHNGADTSHMRYYQSMRLPNVQSTKELVKMCGSRRIPFHFVSTAAVSPYYAAGGASQTGFPEVSLADCIPPTDGFGGYPASKWASERLLERLHDEVEGGWPVFIHRPSLISRQLDNPALDVVHNIRHYASRMNAVPVAPNISGYLDTVSLSEVVDGILDTLRGPRATAPDVRFFHYCGEEQLPLDDMKSWILVQNGGGEPIAQSEVGELQLGEWARRAAEMGMDPTLVAFVASVAGQRELVYPKVMKRERTAVGYT